jgi:type II secretory pathway component GspD/PulD (secretin)
MRNRTSTSIVAAVALLASAVAPAAGAQSEAAATARKGGVPVEELIATVAKRTGKTFIVDPRVQGEALLIGADPTRIDYAELLSVLQVHGFAAVERGNVVRVIPDTTVRQQPVAIVTGKESHPDAEFVTKTWTLQNVPAAQLVPILRPLLPQAGHLVAFPCTNMLMMVDTFGNVQRIEKLVQALDVGGPYTPPKCDGEGIKPGS